MEEDKIAERKFNKITTKHFYLYNLGIPFLTWLAVADADPNIYRSPGKTLIYSRLRKIRPYVGIKMPFFRHFVVFSSFLFASVFTRKKDIKAFYEVFTPLDTPFGKEFRRQ